MKAAPLFSLVMLTLATAPVHATSNHEYGANEYDTVAAGISPDGKYSITTHGAGDLGYDAFHVYLTNAITGKKIGPLEEIRNILDTGADAYCAQWSADSGSVTILFRAERHKLVAFTYRIARKRAFLLSGPVDATDAQTAYWQSECQNSQPSPRIFGTPKSP